MVLYHYSTGETPDKCLDSFHNSKLYTDGLQDWKHWQVKYLKYLVKIAPVKVNSRFLTMYRDGGVWAKRW